MVSFKKLWNEHLKEPVKKLAYSVVTAFFKKLIKKLKSGLDRVKGTREITVVEVPIKKPKKITWKSSPNWSSRKGNEITAIILHHTGKGGLKAAVSWFKSKKSGVSAHYVVDRDGTIIQMVKEENKAWHAGKSVLHTKAHVNRFSIGIEIVSTGKDGYTDEQYESVAFLCKVARKKYDIEDSYIVGHNAIAPDRKIDPANFEWERLFSIIESTPL